MDINSFIIGFKKGKASGGGSDFPVKEFFEGTCKELTLTGLDVLKGYAFYSNSVIEKLTTDAGTLKSYSISDCPALTEINLLEGVTYLELYSIGGCQKITSIILPKSLRAMNWKALINFGTLKTVTFLGTPEMIGSMYNSSVFPTSVTTINVPWSEGEVAGAPWGATSAQINYNYTGE